MPSPLPFAHTHGPHSARVAIVGEAWGENEDKHKVPLVGWSGVELARMLYEARITKQFHLPQNSHNLPYSLQAYWQSTGLFITNTFAERPFGNNIEENWCVAKKDLPPDYSYNYIKPGKYIHPQYLHHVERLFAELAEVKPNLIIALGGIACWALLGTTGVTKLRGAVAWSDKAGAKVLPTFHPAYVLRQWQARPIVLQDLLKAAREAAFPEIRRPERWVTINPSLEDIREWMRRPAKRYAVDIETAGGQITMIGFARGRSDALVIPFVKDGKGYWPSHEDEVRAWKLVKELLEGPQVKIFQNGLYDLSYIVKAGIRPKNCTEDTMLLHHSLFPELRKGLGFLGSVYTDEVAWKLMRSRPKEQMVKREE